MKSTHILWVSLALNLILLGAIGLLLSGDGGSPGALPNRLPPPPAAEVRSTHDSATTLSWAQIESSDDSTYAANLRDIGCPEDTINEIISAKVARLNAQGRQSEVVSGSSNEGAVLTEPVVVHGIPGDPDWQKTSSSIHGVRAPLASDDELHRSLNGSAAADAKMQQTTKERLLLRPGQR